jgi:hypothetical protein
MREFGRKTNCSDRLSVHTGWSGMAVIVATVVIVA